MYFLWDFFLILLLNGHERCLKAVKRNGLILEIITKQTPEICLAAIKENWASLKYVKSDQQTPELCLAAIQINEFALMYIEAKNQTREICLAAVQKHGCALKYVVNQTPEICLAAVENCPGALKYVNPIFRNQMIISMYIKPTEIIPFPAHLNKKDFTDPIALEELVEGEIYGFLIEGERWYLAGSLKEFNKMIEYNFKGSTKMSVFVPFKNTHICTRRIKWVRL